MLQKLIEALSGPSAYSHPVQEVEIRHTHISVVFLAGPFAYKIKKPVNLGFLDFSTLEKRRYFCEQEVRLNRRLAPQVYHGVVPVVSTREGLHIEGQGETVEWAVKMDRLPEDATLLNRLQHGQIDIALIERLAHKIASFHAGAEGGPHVAAFGHFDVVAQNARENFTQAAPQVNTTLSRTVFERLQTLTEQHLERLRSTMEKRTNAGVPRDTHGDLHLDHVYLFPDREPPALKKGDRTSQLSRTIDVEATGKVLSPFFNADDLVIIDCIEFNERFRFADPVSDMAFLVMDLLFHGRRDLAQAFANAYFHSSGDDEGRTLLPFYTAYRAAVRGKVEGFELLESEIPAAERSSALQRARGHWLLALGQLEQPSGRPCLVLVAGLPGTGKSTLAQGLAKQAGFQVIRTDVIRKQLAGLRPEEPTPSALHEELYSTASTERTYAEALRQSEQLLFEGKRVIVDANFPEENQRRAFLDAAARHAVPGLLLRCKSNREAVRRRLAQRQDDVSDADWSVYGLIEDRWEEIGPLTQEVQHTIPTDGPREAALAQALEVLRGYGLVALTARSQG